MIKKYRIYLAWVFACIGFLVSLYFSEIEHVLPCNICWYQRICLYPLAIILGIAAFKGSCYIVPYVLPLVIIGLILALYQIAIQEIPGFEPLHLCGSGASCSEKLDIGLGAVTMPMFAALNFLLILFFLGFTSATTTDSDI